MADIYDEEIDEGTNNANNEGDEGRKQEAEPKQQASASSAVPNEPVKEEPKGKVLSDEEYRNFQVMQQERELKELEAGFKKQYGDKFDMSKVTDKLLELDKQNPGYAAKYFNPIGLENIYLTHFKDKPSVSEDEYDVVRGGAGGGVDRSEMIRRINKGEISQSEKYAFLGKYFN